MQKPGEGDELTIGQMRATNDPGSVWVDIYAPGPMFGPSRPATEGDFLRLLEIARSGDDAARGWAAGKLHQYRGAAPSHVHAEILAFLGRQMAALVDTENPVKAVAALFGIGDGRPGRPRSDDMAFAEEVHWLRSNGLSERQAVEKAAEVLKARGEHRAGGAERWLKVYRTATREHWSRLQAAVALRHIESDTQSQGRRLERRPLHPKAKV